MAEKKSKYNVGGEAVIEGVMMRSPHYYAVAVRRADKSISVVSGMVNSAADKFPMWKWPFFRGILGMYESMKLGFKALTISSNYMEEDLNKKLKPKKTVTKKETSKTSEGFFTAISFILAIALAVGLFILLPYGINKLIAKKFTELNDNNYYFNIGMVVFKFLIFFLYIWGISFLEDVKRLFQYHGAEHKSIYAFEAGKKLVYANIKPYTTKHPRCGTAFIIITVLVSLVFFIIFLPAGLKWWQRILYEIPLLLPIVGFSYELLKLSDKHSNNPLVKLFIAPGLAFQSLTTKEPDKLQLEVAVKSLNAVIALENAYIKKHPIKKKAKKK
ncbi:MAG: DUF1385 domain-containing protein [bacterium]